MIENFDTCVVKKEEEDNKRIIENYAFVPVSRTVTRGGSGGGSSATSTMLAAGGGAAVGTLAANAITNSGSHNNVYGYGSPGYGSPGYGSTGYGSTVYVKPNTTYVSTGPNYPMIFGILFGIIGFLLLIAFIWWLAMRKPSNDDLVTTDYVWKDPVLPAPGHTAPGHTAPGHTALGHTALGHTAPAANHSHIT